MHVQIIKITMAIIKNKKKKIKAPKITTEEAAVIAAKTGYSVSGVQRIVRARSTNPRHRQVLDLYAKVLYLRSLHEENYREDLKRL